MKQLREQLVRAVAKKDKYKGVAREQANLAASLVLQVRSLEEQLEKERTLLFSQRAERELSLHSDSSGGGLLGPGGGGGLGGGGGGVLPTTTTGDAEKFFTIPGMR